MSFEHRMTTAGRGDRARSAISGLTGRLDSTPIGATWSRLLEVEFVDRSVALAAKLFVSFFPLLIVAASITGGSVHDDVVNAVMDRLGVSGDALRLVQQSLRHLRGQGRQRVCPVCC